MRNICVKIHIKFVSFFLCLITTAKQCVQTTNEIIVNIWAFTFILLLLNDWICCAIFNRGIVASFSVIHCPENVLFWKKKVIKKKYLPPESEALQFHFLFLASKSKKRFLPSSLQFKFYSSTWLATKINKILR